MKVITCNKFPQFSLKLIDDKIIVEASSRTKIYPILKALFFKDSSENTLSLSMNIFKSNIKNISDKLGLDSEELKDFLSIDVKETLDEHPELESKINGLKATLYKYQKDCINYGTYYKYSLMGCAVGLGKTLISLGITYNCKKTIVIVPASLKDNYKKEVEKFTNKKAIVIKKWQDCDKIKDETIIIINYEIMEKCLNIFKGCDAIVCDEVQKITNPMAKISKTLYSIVMNNKPEYFIGLSGTITNGKVGQFFQLLRICSLSPNDCGLRLQEDKRYNIHFRFQQFFSHEKYNGFGSSFYGFKNYPELKKLLKKKYISQTVEDNLPELPSIIRQFKQVDVNFDSEQERLLLEGFENTKASDGELTTIKRLHAVSKIEGTFKFVRDLIESGEKVIIFSDHRQPTIDLNDLFIREGVKVSLINGDTKIEERQKQVNSFQEGNSQVFIATIPTANSGFTLTSSSIVVINDCSWNPAHIVQCIARSRRIGQKNTVRAFFMVNGKIDKIIIKTLLQKLKVMNIVNTDGRTEDFEIMD